MNDEQRAELSAMPPPLSRIAKKNLATFMGGDIFNSASLVRGGRGDVAFYAVEPSVVVAMSHEAVAELILHPHKTRADNIASYAGMLRSFVWVILEDLKRPVRYLNRRRIFHGTGMPKRSAAELERRTGRMMLINRRRVLASRAQLLCTRGKRSTFLSASSWR